jgi:hypothetical protein
LILPALLLALTADLDVLSVTPEKTPVLTEETFAYTVRVRNHGPDAAEQATIVAGVNARGVLKKVIAPAGWTCDQDLPKFGYAVSCTTPSFPPDSEVEVTLTLTSPNPLATPYRLGGSARTTGSTDPNASNDLRQTVQIFHPSATRAELVMTARGTTFDVRNDGPDDASEIMAIFTGTAIVASGDGWTCGAPSASVVCTRAVLPAGTSASITTRGVVEGRVRAEKIYDSNTRNNVATTGPTKLKRRTVRP